MEYLQQELNLGVPSASVPVGDWRSPINDPYWDELLPEAQSTCLSVGEQVSTSTKKSAHQQEYTHFVETYWVERKGEKYWYFRYTWMDNRKLRRKYIGSVNSTSRYKCTLMVKEMIGYGATPDEISQTSFLNR